MIACSLLTGTAWAQFDSAPFRRVLFGASSSGPFVTAVADCSVISAPKGSVCTDTDDGKLYKKTGTGTSGWTELGTGSGDVTGPGSSTDNALTRFDSTTGKVIQNSAVTLDDTGLFAFPDGIRQVFNPNGTNAGINVGSQSGDPGSPSNGDLWYDSAANELTARINGANVSLGSGGGAPTTAQYVTLATDGTLSNERVLTGTSNQITVTDGGAGGNVTLSTPQNLHTAATPQFAGLGVGTTASSRLLNLAGSSSSTWKFETDGTVDAVVNQTSSTALTSTVGLNVTRNYTGNGSLGTNLFGVMGGLDATPTADIARDIYGLFGWSQGHGAQKIRTLYGFYGFAQSNDTLTVEAWDPTVGGGLFGAVGDAYTAGTGAIPTAASVVAWGGAASGSVATNFYRVWVPQFYEYGGTITNHVAVQIDDQVTGASGITNNWAIKYDAPSSKTFAVKANGDLTLGGATVTFPASNASGCLGNNGSGTLSWTACSSTGSGYATVQDEGSGLTARATVNFTGAGVSCVDNSGASRTDCTIAGGSGTPYTIGITVDGAGSVLTTGVKGFREVPATGTITKATVLSTDASVTSCSVVFDVWKDTYANYAPTVADTITASAKPTLSSATKATDATLTGWTTAVTAGDILAFNIDSVSSCTRVTLTLTVTP